jgi:hypothetical protein
MQLKPLLEQRSRARNTRSMEDRDTHENQDSGSSPPFCYAGADTYPLRGCLFRRSITRSTRDTTPNPRAKPIEFLGLSCAVIRQQWIKMKSKKR